MTVLSDKSIKRAIDAEKLVEGDTAQAEHCAYEFTPGRLYFGGIDGERLAPVDFEKEPDQSSVIKPGVLAWIRSRETVNMPEGHVGLWVQTNTLSRQGLLLLNMSLVEPGYKGFLTAAFVNFGRVPVRVGSDTKIAKLMFLDLDETADSLVPARNKRTYDAAIEEIVVRAPTTFLRVEDFLPDLERAERDAAEQVEKAAAEAKTAIVAALDEQKRTTRSAISDEVRADLKKFVWKMIGGFGAGLALFALTFSFFYSRLFPAVIKDWDTRADVAAQKALDAKAIKVDIEQLREELSRRKRSDDLNDVVERLDEIERRLDEVGDESVVRTPPVVDEVDR